MIPAGESISASPRYLVEITLKNSGPTLYFSDRSVTVGGQPYEDYLEDLSGLGEDLGRADSGGLNAAVALRFRNDPYRSYGYLVEIGETYPFEGAECVIKEAFLGAGEAPEAETLFKGVLDEPREIDLMGFTCSVSSMLMRADKEWKQGILNVQDWPSAREDVGRLVPVIYGSAVLVPALRADWGARTTLQADLTDVQTSLELSDGDRFPASDFDLWVDDEKIHVTARSGNACTGLTRGYGGTQASPHAAGAAAWEAKAAYDSVLAGHQLHSVGNIFAEVQGRLWRVTSGVSAVFEGGRHLLRATEAVRVKGVVENIDVVDAIDVEDTIGVDDGIAIEDGITINDGISINDGIGVDQGSHAHGSEKQVIQYSTTSFPQVLNIDDSCTGGRTQNYDSFSGTRDKVIYRISVTINLNGVSGDYPADRITVKAGCGGYIKTQFTPSSSETGFDIQFTVLSGEGQIDADTSFVSVLCDGDYGEFFNSTLQINSAERIIYTSPDASAATGVARTGSVTRSGAVSRSGGVSKTGTVSKTGSASKTGTVTREGEVVSMHMVERFHAVASGYKDLTGNFGGVGSLVERPDWVIKHFLVNLAGFTLSDIDDASFAAAGSSYASAVSGGYRFAFSMDRRIRPSEFLRRLAFECRSTLGYRAGKWRLDFIPDAAPSAVRTIAKEELAGEHAKFVFSKSPWLDVENDLTARFSRLYSPLGTESAWLGTSKTSDAASKTKYGTYPGEFDFEAIRLQAVADDVLGHILLQRKAPLLRAEFPVFWEHFDLAPGDTVEAENPLFGGRKFYIESIRRLDAFRAEVRALEWW